MQSPRPCLFVLTPSLRMSGGVKEIVRLTQELINGGEVDAVIAAMWRHAHEIDTGGIPVVHLFDAQPLASRALVQLPSIGRAFRRQLHQLRARHSRVTLLLTHYTTYPLAWMAPTQPRLCFNQDMEWRFVPKQWRALLKRAILGTNRHSTVVTTNAYVTETYQRNGIAPFGEAAIWADPSWLASRLPEHRDIDVLMLLRGSTIKRLDLYLQAIALLQARTSLRLAVITPDASIADPLRDAVQDLHLRPTDAQMRELYARSRLFLLLSDVEGFGLPPLEAMGSGCIPACRDAGGVRCYMQGEFATLLFPRELGIEEIVRTIVARLESEDLPHPESAREAFVTGLDASRTRRQDCVRRLRQWLTLGAPA